VQRGLAPFFSFGIYRLTSLSGLAVIRKTLAPMKRLLSSLALRLALSATRSEATWYAGNVENGADVIMMDLRWPW
jgi:hypothetical protein